MRGSHGIASWEGGISLKRGGCWKHLCKKLGYKSSAVFRIFFLYKNKIKLLCSHNSPRRGAAGEEGLWWGALPKLGAVGSELLGPPPALVVPEQRGGPQSFEPQIAARIK